MSAMLLALLVVAPPPTAAPATSPDGPALQDPLTTATFLAEMHDLRRLARWPSPPYKLLQFSSYDRRSNLPQGPHWFANADGFGGEQVPSFAGVLEAAQNDGETGYLICDVQQPGVIVRTWSAAIEGRLRVFLDDAAEPVYDGAADEFMMRRYRYYASLLNVDPATAGDAFEQRQANYFPIAFAKRCRMIWIGNLNKVHFYQVQIRTYPAGTPIRSFSPDDLRTHAADVAATAEALRPREQAEPPADAQKVEFRYNLFANRSTDALRIEDGPGALAMLQIRLLSHDVEAALRGVVMRVYFDDFSAPHIQSPVGDFFGLAPGRVAYQTLPFHVTADGQMTCRFVMPFARSCSIRFDNTTSSPIQMQGVAWRIPWKWDDQSMHFRAKWRVQHDLLAQPRDAACDLPFLVARGQGVYVGTAVYLMNPSPIPTCAGSWWGEGDEKIFVDDDRVPSTFGTGSEDYFNYAWSSPDIFEYPYFSQPICTGPDTRGYITNNRWHIIDAIPFERFLAFYMELWSHVDTPGLSYARIGYHYARPGLIDDHVPPQHADLRVPPVPAWSPLALGAAAHATFFEAEQVAQLEPVADGQEPPAAVENDPFASGGKLVALKRRADGPAQLKLRIGAPAAGRYAVVLTCVSGPLACDISGRVAEQPLLGGNGETSRRLHSPKGPRLVNLWYEPVDLPQGDSTLTLDVTSGPLRVDFAWIQPRQ